MAEVGGLKTEKNGGTQGKEPERWERDAMKEKRKFIERFNVSGGGKRSLGGEGQTKQAWCEKEG